MVEQQANDPAVVAGHTSGKGAGSKESISDQWIDFLLKQAKAASAEANQAQASSEAGPHTIAAGLQEGWKPGTPLLILGTSPDAEPLIS